MLNKAILMGRLTRDPELRHTQSNIAVCSFTLAIDRGRKNTNGDRETDFIDCVAWGKQAEFVQQWFTKGMMAIVTGRIQSRNWEDKNGNKRVSVEVHADEITFGETKKSRDAYQSNSDSYGYDAAPARQTPASSMSAPAPSFDMPSGGSDFSELDDDDDSDVPF